MTMPQPSANSYGTVTGVVALARTWTRDNKFIDDVPPYYEDGTNPQLSSVVAWIDQISAMLNTALGKYGFVTPLVSSSGRLAAQAIVEQLTADLVKYVNNQGRFFSQRFQDSGYSLWRTLRSDLDLWVQEFAPGLANGGETQNASDIDEIGFRSHDESGEETFPIFQRKAFGNQFQNWTK